jgi:hypothetical protein
MSLTTVLLNKPISFVITDDNLFATKGVLTQSGRSKCLYVLKNINEILLLTKTLKLKNSKILHKDVDFSSLEKYNFISYNLMKEYLIERKDKYDLFDQIFIPINETKNVDLFLIIKTINQIRKDKKIISNICYILRNNSIEASYELKLEKDNVFTHNCKLDVDINYSGKHGLRKGDKNLNFTIIDDIESTRIEQNKNILVILNSAKDIQHMYYHMLKKLDKRKYFVSSIYASGPNKLNYIDRKDEEKIMVYLLSSDLTIRIPLPDIGYIFDSFVYSSDSGGQIFYNSKDRANKYINYFSPTEYINLLEEEEQEEKFHLTRYVSCEYFENSYAYDVPSMGLNLFYHNFLLLIDNSYDPIGIFRKFIDMGAIGNIFTTLNNLKILNENKIIINYKILFSFGLYLRPSLLIMKAIEKKEPVYPFIVLASIINHSEYGFFIPSVQKGCCNSGMLKKYLDVFVKYSKEIRSINPDRDALNDWCDKESVSKVIMNNILNSIRNISHTISSDQKILLGLFDSNNLIQRSIPYLLDIYIGFVYKQVDRHVHHYSNDTTVVKIINHESDYPQNVISFKSVKPAYKSKDNMDTITFYLGFNIS